MKISLIFLGLLVLVNVFRVGISRGDEPAAVIFDTDITGDCDDVLALSMLHALADRHECEIKAVTISKINPLTAPFVDAINTYYGRGELPIGVTLEAQKRESKYLHLCKIRDGNELRYPHDLLSSHDAPDAIEVLRKVLSESPDKSVTIIQVGLASNLADLIDSGPDATSSLTGTELLSRKCKLISVMAGCFGPALGKEHHAEANVVNGIEAMRRFTEGCPDNVPVVWSDFRIGLAARYPRASIANDFWYERHHLVREAYLAHSGPDHDRPTWDLTSVLFAVRPDSGYFGLSGTGRVEVDADGLTHFAPDPNGRDRYLTMSQNQATRVIEVQRTLASQPPSRR